MVLSSRKKLTVVAVTCVLGAGLWVGTGQAASGTAAPAGPQAVTAALFAKVAGVDPGVFGTSLEGAAFDKDGRFYFVDTTAPQGDPKLMSLDLGSRKVTDLYTDTTSMLNCIGFAPDGTMYLCDLENGADGGGRVVRYDPAAHTLTDVLTEDAGTAIVPDDLAVAGNGDLFIADYRGTPNGPTGPVGRIVRRAAADGSVTDPVTGLAHPNGIVLTPDQSGLWIDQDLSGTLDHVAWQLPSPAATAVIATVHTAAYLSLGANAYTDSLTVDGSGNVYMAVYGLGEVLEFDPNGNRVGKVVIPGDAPDVTHVAIEPGTRRAFVTASGPGGGYVYTFPALAAAPAGAPNGG